MKQSLFLFFFACNIAGCSLYLQVNSPEDNVTWPQLQPSDAISFQKERNCYRIQVELRSRFPENNLKVTELKPSDVIIFQKQRNCDRI